MECIKCKAQIPDGSAFCNMCGKPQTPQKRKHKKRANGTGNISKLSGSRAKPWMVRKGDAFVGTYETRQEAQRALDRLTDIAVSEKFNMTFAEIYAQRLPEHEREITKSGKTGYTSACKYCDQLFHTQEVTGSSPVVSTIYRLISQDFRRFSYVNRTF